MCARTGTFTLCDQIGIVREYLMLTTGGVVALQILARPESGDILAQARRDPELDGRLGALAIRAAACRETLLPLHVNVFAGTLANLGGLATLHDAVREAGAAAVGGDGRHGPAVHACAAAGAAGGGGRAERPGLPDLRGRRR